MKKCILYSICLLLFSSAVANAAKVEDCIVIPDDKIIVTGPRNIIGGTRFNAFCHGYTIKHKDGTEEHSDEKIPKQVDTTHNPEDMEKAKQKAKEDVYDELESRRKAACEKHECN